MTFYLHAAKFSGHSVSKHFKIPSGYRTRKAQVAPNDGAADSTDAKAQEKVTEPPTTDAELKTEYVKLLMEKAKAEEKLDSSLLDRIEKLLGYATGKE